MTDKLLEINLSYSRIDQILYCANAIRENEGYLTRVTRGDVISVMKGAELLKRALEKLREE